MNLEFICSTGSFKVQMIGNRSLDDEGLEDFNFHSLKTEEKDFNSSCVFAFVLPVENDKYELISE